LSANGSPAPATTAKKKKKKKKKKPAGSFLQRKPEFGENVEDYD
jgi:hypothetical protein